MFLTSYNLSGYLTASGLLDARALVDGDFVVVEAGRRNRNFKILRRENGGLFIKQIKSLSAEATGTLRREAAFYRAIAASPAYTGLRDLTPPFVAYDERRHILSVRLVGDAETLAERSLYDGPCDPPTAAMLGRALAAVHMHGPVSLGDGALRPIFTFQPPWPLMLDRTGSQFLTALGPIGPSLSQALQSHPTLAARLTALRGSWQYDSLIHGDMKWDNCLLTGQKKKALCIVDWEMVDVGDGAWDVAGILKEYVVAAIIPVPRPGVQEPATTPLETLVPSASAFWNAYADARQLGPSADSYFERAVRLTAARLVIGVLEYLLGATELGEIGQRILQTSAQILELPHLAAAQLLGARRAA